LENQNDYQTQEKLGEEKVNQIKGSDLEEKEMMSNNSNFKLDFSLESKRTAGGNVKHSASRYEEIGRVLWLIDAGYMNKAKQTVRKEGDYDFDYLKLRERVEGGGPKCCVYYFNSEPPFPNEGQDKFNYWLGRAPDGPGFTVELYPLKQSSVEKAYCTTCNEFVSVRCHVSGDHELSREQQKRVDVALVTRATTLMDRYDTLLLSSGDGDFLPAVEHIKEKGKRLELLVFRHGVSNDLQHLANRIEYINDYASEVERTKKVWGTSLHFTYNSAKSA
jgi:hypothetical protein